MNPQNNYDFIMNPGQAPKPSLFASAGGGMRRRLLFIAGGALVLIILMFIVGKWLGGNNDKTIPNLVGLVQTQQEVIRVATQGTQKAAQVGNQFLAINTEATVITQQKALIALLNKNGQKLSNKQLALKYNATTDTQLATAQQNSTYDITYAQIMQNDLSGYLSEMKTTYDGTSSKTVRTMLKADYSQTAALLQQVPSASALTAQ